MLAVKGPGDFEKADIIINAETCDACLMTNETQAVESSGNGMPRLPCLVVARDESTVVGLSRLPPAAQAVSSALLGWNQIRIW